jgi:hypothetical protein
MTPSRKLNRFLYRRKTTAGRPAIPMAEPDREPPDRDLSPETKAIVEQVKATLKAVER